MHARQALTRVRNSLYLKEASATLSTIALEQRWTCVEKPSSLALQKILSTAERTTRRRLSLLTYRKQVFLKANAVVRDFMDVLGIQCPKNKNKSASVLPTLVSCGD